MTSTGGLPTGASATGASATGASATGGSSSEGGAATTRLEARRSGTVAWTRELEGRGGPLAAGGTHLFAALGGTGSVAAGAVLGEPGAALVAVDRATGTVAWRVALDAGGWVTVSALAATPDGGVVVGGTYTGGLRAQHATVGTAGRTDGFVLFVRATGEVAWLVRAGGVFADTVQGVAARAGANGALRIAIAGTFQAGADLEGTTLSIFDERSPFPDGFVAELDAAGHRVWSAVFGGKQLESVAGVAIDRAGKVVVGASSAGELHVGALDLIAQGPSDGVVGWWNPDGSPHHAIVIGGADFDGVRGIAAAGPSVVVGGFYSGAMTLGGTTLTAAGGDDAFLVALDANGAVAATWPVTGAGREEIASLAAVRGGFAAGVAYTAAAEVAGARLAAPADPMSGSAIIVRGVR